MCMSLHDLCLCPLWFRLLFGKWRRPLCDFCVVVGVLTLLGKRTLAHRRPHLAGCGVIWAEPQLGLALQWQVPM